jgi:hypothetical protein
MANRSYLIVKWDNCAEQTNRYVVLGNRRVKKPESVFLHDYSLKRHDGCQKWHGG